MEKNNNIGENYKKVFEEFEVAPSPETWTKIEKSLGKKSIFQQFKLPLISLAGALLILSGYLIFKPQNMNQNSEPVLASNYIEPSMPVSEIPIASADTLVVQYENSSFVEKKESRNEIKKNSTQTIPKTQNNKAEEKSTVDNMQNSNVDSSKIIINNSKLSSVLSDNSEVTQIENPAKEINKIPESETQNTIKEVASETTSETESTNSSKINEDILIPNAFSLSHLENSTFKPSFVCETCHSFEMIIYSKAGEVIYKTQDIQTGWNGTYRGQNVKPETYIYTITYKKGDTGNIKRGFVLVLN